MDRRHFMIGLGAGLGSVTGASALANTNAFVDLGWKDLLPRGQTSIPPSLRNLIDHDQAPMASQQPQSTGVRSEWNEQVVRLPGFVVPLDYSGSGVTAFILVPFVGACIHVPPPPANQLVFVTTQTPYQSGGLYEPVDVIGELRIGTMNTQLAEIAYTMTADSIKPYR
ncbi:DUF3299 domain-containing protein [Algirhabdus cladophorae]